jgi:endoglucanase
MSKRCTLGAVASAGLLAVAAAACSSQGPGTDPGPDPAQALYHDPDTQVADWVANHPNDSRTPAIRDRIASQAQARWFVEADTGSVAGEVADYVGPAVEAGEVPQLVVYAIPGRDCGGASDGGASDMAAYQQWIGAMAGALGDSLGDERALVVLEPDALAQEDCLNANQVAARHQAIATAVDTLEGAGAGVEVYLDAGHSNWNSPATQADRLLEAGVLDSAGFSTNVSNFNTTADEVAYGQQLIDELGDDSLRQVIDVSRNGNGPAPGAEWCDPAGRAVGESPTLDTGEPTVAALLWVKLPGEADGCAATPGTFVPDLAYALATN